MKHDADSLPGGLIFLDEFNKVTAVNRTLCDWLGRDEVDYIGDSPGTWMTRSSAVFYLGHVLPSLRLHGFVEEALLTFSNVSGKQMPAILSGARLPGPDKGFQLLILPMQRRNLVEEQLQQARKVAEEALADKEEALAEMHRMADELKKRHEELAALNGQLEQLATRDSLTGLHNRRVYDREIEAQLALYGRTKRPFSLVLADIDWFKQFNDSFGHDIGDRVLKEVSRYLSVGLRDIDTLVRMGGEEFALILPETDAAAAALVAERKRAEMEELQSPHGGLTMSFGVTEVRDGDTKGDLYGRADASLYRAKNLGRNQVCIG